MRGEIDSISVIKLFHTLILEVILDSGKKGFEYHITSMVFVGLGWVALNLDLGMGMGIVARLNVF